MRLNVDAWLERKQPRIRVVDVDTGLEVVYLGPEQVQALMDSGAICLGDMDDNSSFCTALFSVLEQEAAGSMETRQQMDNLPKGTKAVDARTPGNVLPWRTRR
jgi:hypothetical protein